MKIGLALSIVAVLQAGAADSQLQWQQVPGGRMARALASTGPAPGLKKMEQTGVLFTNMLAPERVLENQIRYNGSGVAAGDVDADGLCDVFFCSLEGRSHLYKNLGNWKFAEITDDAGVGCEGLFTSGAAFADVDGDADLDLLVNAYGAGTRLFLNDGKGRFTPKSDASLVQKYGSSSLTLGDIDGNGTLDLYVANYSTTTIADTPGMQFTVQRLNGKLTVVAADGVPVQGNMDLMHRFLVDESTGGIKQNGEPDILYLNKGNGVFEAQSWTGGRFLDENGRPLNLAPYDWGLSAAFHDFTGDGHPDLYVCNDLFSPDRAWINLGDGRFQAASHLAIRHMSDSSMGLDFADINRDGIDDFLTLEMLSRRHQVRAVQVVGLHEESSQPGDIHNRPPYNRNMLFLGRGDGTFAEIAQLAGLEASDWSWMPAFLDMDLDGYEDVLIVTGYFRDSLNADLQAEFERQRTGKRLSIKERMELQRRVFPLHRQPNLAYRNRGDLTFEEAGDRWGFNEVSISQGMCLADLDNDADLDVLVNNFEAPPSLYRNEAPAPRTAVRLKGLPPNTRGIGAKVQFRGGPVPQSQQIVCGGRYASADDPERVFATGTSPGPFTIEVLWRSGRHSLLTNVQPNCVYEIDESQSQAARPQFGFPSPPLGERGQGRGGAATPLFKEVTPVLKHVHRESAFDDFARQPLLPRKLSQAGPGICWFDVNNDGWADLLIGGGRTGELGVHTNDGKGALLKLPVPPELSALKAEHAALVGVSSRTNASVLVAQSNYEQPHTNSVWQITVSGSSVRVLGGLPSQESCPGPLAMADVDGDAWLDLFVGGRVAPGKYPVAASSRLYRGQPGGGYRLDKTTTALLREAGLVNGAVFSDLDGDGWPDLVLALDWGPLRVFQNRKGSFRETTRELGFDKHRGWWNGVAAGDFDGDGRMDLAASNWGRNSRYERYRPAPIRLYYGDWNGIGQMELLEAVEAPELKKVVPLKGFKPVREALPWVAGTFNTFAEYGAAGIQQVLGEYYANCQSLQADTLESMVFLNRGGHFEGRPLPIEAQFAPAFGICVSDFDGDGCEDIFLSQNFLPVDAEGSRYDAGRGLCLRGDGRGGFIAVPAQKSGIEVYGEQRGAAACDYDKDGRVDLAVTQNAGETKLFHNETATPGLRVVLEGTDGNLPAYGAQVRLLYPDGEGPIREVHGGSGYWSQNCATQVLGQRSAPSALWVRWPGGATATWPLTNAPAEIVVRSTGNAHGQ